MKLRGLMWPSKSIGGSLLLLAAMCIAGAVATDPHGRLGATVGSLPSALAAAESSASERVEIPRARVPVQFEVNRGQAAPGVDYIARARGYIVSLDATGAALTLQAAQVHSEMRHAPDERLAQAFAKHRLPHDVRQPPPKRAIFRLQLLGANPHAPFSGLDQLPGRVNYASGADRAKWFTNIPTYARVRYQAVYPGIDLIYHGNNQGGFEYDFHVAPGADPASIRLRYQGVEALALDSVGDLVIRTAAGEVRQHKPLIYQEIAGLRRAVSGGYVLKGSHEAAFQVAPYDASRSLVIDPTITYGTFIGGPGDPLSGDKDSGNGIAVDAAGNIYVVGNTNSLGRYDTDIFVRKFDPSGTKLLYATYLDSGNADDEGYGIAVDAAGNAYVTGQFGDAQLGYGRGVLVAKLSPTGVPIYEGTFGADAPYYSDDVGYGIAVDDLGNAYVVGQTWNLGTPFPTTKGAFQETGRGGQDAFVAKINPSGTDFVYSTLLSSSGDDIALGIALRKVADGYHAYVIGTTSLADDFPTTPNALQPHSGGAADVFVVQLNATGSAPVYSTYLGGNGNDEAGGIAVDSVGNAYLTGWTSLEPLVAGPHFPIVNAFQPVYGGDGGGTPAGSNAFVAKLNPSGTALVYSSYMGGGGGYGLADAGTSIQADSAGNAYLTGYTETDTDIFTGAHFPILNAFQTKNAGGADAFVAKITAQGALVFSSYLGGHNNDGGNGIGLGKAGTAYANNVYLAGTTWSADFPVTSNAFQKVIGGACDYPSSCPDAFLTVISSNSSAPTPTPTRTPTRTATRKPTQTATRKPTPTATRRATPTATHKPTLTAPRTQKPTATATPKPAAAASIHHPAQPDVRTASETTLYVFPSDRSKGCYPNGTLMRDASGALYGATGRCSITLTNTVFKLEPPPPGQTGWTISLLHRFSGGLDGNAPNAGLVMDAGGAVYGTATDYGQYLQGVVFRLNPPAPAQHWTETVLHAFDYNFATNIPDGNEPGTGLVRDANGALYGTTIAGGTLADPFAIGFGTVFRLTPPAPGQTQWTETVLYRFKGGADGDKPASALTLDATGA
jgi:hypothetical protein